MPKDAVKCNTCIKESFSLVISTFTMPSLFDNDYSVLSRLFFILRLFGTTFLRFDKLCFVLKRFVFGETTLPIKHHVQEQHLTKVFKAEVESLLSITASKVPKNDHSLWSSLHEYGIDTNFPTGGFLISPYNNCRFCAAPLTMEKKHHVIVVYHLKYGITLGSRVKKFCRVCKIYEHYGYYTQDGKKHYDENALNQDYLLSSDETAFDMDILKDLSSLLVVGALPFSTYAAAFNKRFNLMPSQEFEKESQRYEISSPGSDTN